MAWRDLIQRFSGRDPSTGNAARDPGEATLPLGADATQAELAATEIALAAPPPRGPVAGVLVGVEGELEGELFSIIAGENRLGRSLDCDVVLPSLRISREHATIVCEDGLFAVVPLSERNPTYVNATPCEGGELCDGDLLRLGRSSFRFRTIEKS